MSIAKSNKKYHVFLFLVSPILGLFYGIKSGSLKVIRWSIFAYTVIYGSLFYSLFYGKEEEGANDGVRHLAKAERHYQYLDFSTWWEELIAILSLDPINNTQSDVFIHVISYIAVGIFGAPFLFFTLVAAVYGYFFSGALVKIFSYIDWKSGYNLRFFYFFLVLLILWRTPDAMQTVRTWTGMWVLIYALLSYHETKNKKYMLLALCPLFIHIGYAMLGIAYWAVLFTGFRNPKIYFIIFIFSIFVSNVVEQTGFLDFAAQTEIGEKKSKAYYLEGDRADEYYESKQESSANFYKKYVELNIHHYVLSGIIIFMFVFLRKRGFGELENTLFSYALAGASFSNFFTPIFAVHNRGWFIAGFLIISLLVIFLSKQDLRKIPLSSLKVKFPLFISALATIPFMLFFISSFLFFTSSNIILMPLIIWIVPESGFTIRDVIVFFL
jgi:hypothetical protein